MPNLISAASKADSNNWRFRLNELSITEATAELSVIGFGERYQNADWNLTENKIALRRWLVDEFLNGDRAVGMLIAGQKGTGKTSLMALIARFFVQFFPTGYVFYKNATGLFTDIYNNSYNEIERAKKCRVLMVDDLGREISSESSRARFYEIIEYRYSRRMPTFVSTNLSLIDLEHRPGMDAVADRFRDEKFMKQYRLVGQSRRVKAN